MRSLKRLLLGLAGLLALGWIALAVYAYWPGEPERPARELASAADRFVTVRGLELRYREYGEAGAGRSEVLLIHGFANSLQSWRGVAPRLAACCRVIAIDMPGYGLSAKPEDFDYRNGSQAQTMIAAAQALGLQRPVYAGHSLGGAVALRAAIADPNAAGLVLLNPGILTTGVPKLVQLTVPPLPRLSARQFGKRAFRERFLKLSYVHPEIVTPQVIDAVMLASRSEGYLTGMTAMMKQYAEGEEVPLLAQVRVPTLILWGNQDRNKPPGEAEELQRRLPGSELVRFDGAGHYVHEEQPEAVAAAMRAAFARWQELTNAQARP